MDNWRYASIFCARLGERGKFLTSFSHQSHHICRRLSQGSIWRPVSYKRSSLEMKELSLSLDCIVRRTSQKPAEFRSSTCQISQLRRPLLEKPELAGVYRCSFLYPETRKHPLHIVQRVSTTKEGIGYIDLTVMSVWMEVIDLHKNRRRPPNSYRTDRLHISR